MPVIVIKSFSIRGASQLPGSIIIIPKSAMTRLSGFVTPAVCQAIKRDQNGGYRLCGAPLREGVNGHLSCADMHCQIPTSSWHKYDHLRRHLR